MRPGLGATASLVAAVALGGAALIMGLGFAVAQGRPDLDLGPASDLLAVHEARAEAAFAAGRDDEAAAHTRAALSEAPLTSHAWARQAALAYRRDQRLGPDAVRALERSYAAAPYGPEITAWRLRLLLDNWGGLPVELRAAALDELKVCARHRPRLLARIADETVDPAGRLAAATALRLARLQRRLDARAETATSRGAPSS